MDTEVRQSLTQEEQRSLGGLAAHVMSYLEIHREAIEGRRSKRMSDSLNRFIEGKSSYAEPSGALKKTGETSTRKFQHSTDLDVQDRSSDLADSSSEDGNPVSSEGIHRRQNEGNMEAVSYEKVFGRAANLLREAFELNDGGGVIFVGAGGTLKHVHDGKVALHMAASTESLNGEDENWPFASPTHQIRTTTTFDPILNAFAKNPEHPAPLLALSTQEVPFVPVDLLSGVKGTTPFQVDKEVLHELFNRYPRGRLWIIDESGLMSASDEEHNSEKHHGHKEAMEEVKTSTWNRGEPTLLREAFPGVRQLMFAPNWNAETSNWTSGCFVWSQNETRVLTSSTDLSFLNSFTKTVMAELSRLDTMLADRQKGDFIGSISHELRSPLHGILASAEFLVETATTSFQQNLISTVDSCGRTLLDTINHILDYSKINSFECNWRPKARSRKAKAGSLAKTFEKPLPSGAPPLLRIYDITDVAAVTEEVVEGIAVGQMYIHDTDITDVTPENRGRTAGKGRRAESRTVGGCGEAVDTVEERVEIIIDIDREDWLFMTQPGALRRVVLNLVGNATKYTIRGTIKVRLQLEKLEGDSNAKMMVLTVTDTGRGISPAFLSSKLFIPFAQVCSPFEVASDHANSCTSGEPPDARHWSGLINCPQHRDNARRECRPPQPPRSWNNR
jgi:signal transduction histidine kinase